MFFRVWFDSDALIFIYVGQGEARLVIFRGKMKATVNGLVPGQFQLIPGSCAGLIALLLDTCEYIYPKTNTAKVTICQTYNHRPTRLMFVTQNGVKADYNNPFNVRIFTILLATYFFDGPQSTAAKYPELFKSSIPDKQHEKEVPEAMLGLVCAEV